MNKTIKRFSIGTAVFLLTLVPFETNLGQQQNQLIKPCTAEPAPEKKEDTTSTKKKKSRTRPKTNNGKKDQQQSKNANCN